MQCVGKVHGLVEGQSSCWQSGSGGFIHMPGLCASVAGSDLQG